MYKNDTKILLFVFIILCFVSFTAFSEPEYGQEILVNSIPGGMMFPEITSLSNGNFVICWHDWHLFEDNQYTIYVQVFNESGEKIGRESIIETRNEDGILNYWPTYEPHVYRITSLSNGNFIICWESYGYHEFEPGIYVQIFNESGEKVGNKIQVTTFQEIWANSCPKIATLFNDHFVVCWKGLSEKGIFAQVFDETGEKIGDEIQVNSSEGNSQSGNEIIALFNGNFVICWKNYIQGDHNHEILAQILNSSGEKIGSEIQIKSSLDFTSVNDIDDPQITPLPNKNFLVCWCENKRSYYDMPYKISAQIFDEQGNNVGEEIQVTTLNYDDICDFKYVPVSSKNNNFIISWNAHSIDTPCRLYSQMFDNQGNKIGSEIKLGLMQDSLQLNQQLISLSNGNFMVCWVSEYQPEESIFAQLIDNQGEVINSKFQVGSDELWEQGFQEATLLTNGDYVICWQARKLGSSNISIYAKIFPSEPRELDLKEFNVISPALNDTLKPATILFNWEQANMKSVAYPWEIFYDLWIDTHSNFTHPTVFKDIQDTSYQIDSIAAGHTYYWKVLAKNLAGDSLWCNQTNWNFVIEEEEDTPVNVLEDLSNQNPISFKSYPNPFTNYTTIEYSFPYHFQQQQLKINIYNLQGQLIKTLLTIQPNKVRDKLIWDGTNNSGYKCSNGIYFCVIESEEQKKSLKLLLIK